MHRRLERPQRQALAEIRLCRHRAHHADACVVFFNYVNVGMGRRGQDNLDTNKRRVDTVSSLDVLFQVGNRIGLLYYAGVGSFGEGTWAWITSYKAFTYIYEPRIRYAFTSGRDSH